MNAEVTNKTAKQKTPDEVRDVKTLEVELMLSAIKELHGYDFRDYTTDSLQRRLEDLRKEYNCSCVSEMIPRILWDESFFSCILNKMTIGVTRFFRDRNFFISVRDNVIPALTTFPYFKVWHAGCSTGEEVYSMAMLLDACGLLDKAIIYGTDINNTSLDIAATGIYPVQKFRERESAFKEVTGRGEPGQYYTAEYDYGKISSRLSKHITFSHHNLVQDKVFGEMNLISCRNVLIYFDQDLQNQVLALMNESLRPGGYLCLGSGESLYNTILQDDFEVVDLNQKIFRKKTSTA